MGAAAATTVSKATAMKVGKRYDWGSERPGVLERRVQMRKQQMSKKRAEVEARLAKIRKAEMAMLDEEERFLEEQAALLRAHRERMKERKRAFGSKGSFIVPKGSFTDERLAEFMSAYPDLTEDEARVLLSMRTSPAANSNEPGTGGASSEPTLVSTSGSHNVSSLVAGTPALEAKAPQAAEPAEAPKAVSPEKPTLSPAPVQREAVPSSDSTDTQADRDWSDFDPDAWQEGEDFPRHLYREVADADRNYFLVLRTDLDEPENKSVSPMVQALRDRRKELTRAQDELEEKHGRNQMRWTAEVIAEAERLQQEITALSKQIQAELARG
ncbi:hypothetical protein [Microvirga sp. M2]|uniref:hypothetical protein n=1 Tax=Microvirga sp. M2 TaxID=3073270 RepID=UPI0039C462C7